jgi:hypothetical protein
MDASAIAAWIGLPIALAGVMVAVAFSSRQVRLARLQNLSPVVLDAFREARSAEWFEARDWIITNLPSPDIAPQKGVSGQSDDTRWNMRRVGFFYDNLGVFVAHGIVSEDLVIGFFGVGLTEVWQRMEPYIRAEARSRDMRYMCYFEDLVVRTRQRTPSAVYGHLKLRQVSRQSQPTR